MKKFKSVLAVASALAMVISCAACGSSGEGDGKGDEEKLLVYYIPKLREEAFWNALEHGAEAAAEELGVELVIQGDPSGSNTAAKQATYIEAAIEMQADAIAFAALDENTTDAALQEAMDAGISVVGFDSDPGAEARDYFVNQADSDGIAQASLDNLAEVMTERGYTADQPANVYIVSSNPTTPNQNTWIESLKKIYYKDYEIPMTENGAIDFDVAKEQTIENKYEAKDEYKHFVLYVDPDAEIIYGGDDYQTAKTQVSNSLTAHMDTNGLISLSTLANAAIYEAITEKGLEDTCVFNGIAVPKDSEEYLKSGVMSEVILWQAYDVGYVAVEAAVSAAKGELDSDVFQSALSGQDKVEGVSTYDADGFKIEDNIISLGEPAIFSLDSVDKFKE